MSESKRLFVVCGLPGTGKTTVARYLADELGGDLLRTDVVRRDVVPDPDYTPDEIRATYDELFARARRALESNGVAVLDGTFRRQTQRDRARAVATDVGAGFDLVYVECPEQVVRDRIAARTDDESEADFSVYRELRSEFEPLDADHHRVDNSETIEETRAQLDALL